MSCSLRMEGITKRFGSVVANNNVDFEVLEGEVHGLVGENGAGKTTLMNVLYGLEPLDSGQIEIFGSKAVIKSPQEAIQLGIGMVHQHFMLVPSIKVIENIILGRAPTRGGLTDYKAARKKVEDILNEYSLSTNLDSKTYQLSVGQMQIVEIIKALYRGARLLILDEPTAVLTPQEITSLYQIIHKLTDQGCSVIFITHKLKEVLAVTDRVTVMRKGKVTGNVITSETNIHELANLMVGREVEFKVSKTPAKPGATALKVENLSALNERGTPSLRGVSLNVRKGEIVGIAGVEGNGQTELVEVISGLRACTGGKIHIGEEDVTHALVRRRREKGVAHIPENRLLLGVSSTCTIQENLMINKYYTSSYSKFTVLLTRKLRDFANDLVRRFDIRTPSTELPASSLSGGNMQKLVLARELDTDPSILLAAQPTRGVDVGGIEYIHYQIVQLRDNDRAILLVSSELDEVMDLSDRILVMYEGEITGEFEGGTVDEFELGLYMTGAKKQASAPMPI